MNKTIFLLIGLSFFFYVGCSSEIKEKEPSDINDVSGNWVYKWGYQGYEPSIEVDLQLNEGGTYSLSLKDGDETSYEIGKYEVDGSKLILNANDGNSHKCSITHSSIRYGKYFLEKQ